MTSSLLQSPSDNTIQYREIKYLYRDAANYKCWGYFVVEGAMSLADITPYMIDEEFFIPEVIGIPSLSPEHWTEDDHMFHEIHSIEPCGSSPTAFTAGELIKRMRLRNELGWFR